MTYKIEKQVFGITVTVETGLSRQLAEMKDAIPHRVQWRGRLYGGVGKTPWSQQAMSATAYRQVGSGCSSPAPKRGKGKEAPTPDKDVIRRATYQDSIESGTKGRRAGRFHLCEPKGAGSRLLVL